MLRQRGAEQPGSVAYAPALLRLTMPASALATSWLSFLLNETHHGSGRGEGFSTGPGHSLNHCGCMAYHHSNTRVQQAVVSATLRNLIAQASDGVMVPLTVS